MVVGFAIRPLATPSLQCRPSYLLYNPTVPGASRFNGVLACVQLGSSSLVVTFPNLAWCRARICMSLAALAWEEQRYPPADTVIPARQWQRRLHPRALPS